MLSFISRVLEKKKTQSISLDLNERVHFEHCQCDVSLCDKAIGRGGYFEASTVSRHQNCIVGRLEFHRIFGNMMLEICFNLFTRDFHML